MIKYDFNYEITMDLSKILKMVFSEGVKAENLEDNMLCENFQAIQGEAKSPTNMPAVR